MRWIAALARRLPFVNPETVAALLQKLADRIHVLLRGPGPPPARHRVGGGQLAARRRVPVGLPLRVRPNAVLPIDLLVAYGLANILAVIPITPRGSAWSRACSSRRWSASTCRRRPRSWASSATGSSTSGCRSRSAGSPTSRCAGGADATRPRRAPAGAAAGRGAARPLTCVGPGPAELRRAAGTASRCRGGGGPGRGPAPSAAPAG